MLQLNQSTHEGSEAPFPLPYSLHAIENKSDQLDAQTKVVQDVMWWVANEAPTDICAIARSLALVLSGELAAGLKHLSQYDGNNVSSSEADLKVAHAYFSGGAPATLPLLKIICTSAGHALTRSVAAAIVLLESVRAFAARLPDMTRRAEASIEISFSDVSSKESGSLGF